MNAQQLIADLTARGGKFELEGESFRVRAPQGIITPELRDQLSEHKPEILTLLRQTDVEIQVSHTAGNCPHCRRPLLVFTHPLDDEVWIACPTKPELFKALRQEATEWCRDCGEKLPCVAGRCRDCIERVMLAPDDVCSICEGLQFWRNSANCDRPAGFAWYCAGCQEPTIKAVIYELSDKEKIDVISNECSENTEQGPGPQ
jgi:hypothetical protein